MKNESNVNTRYYLKVVIYVLLTFGIGYLPPFGSVTEMGMKVLGVFIGTVFGWMALGFIWPSLFSMVALGIIGYASVNTIIIQGLGFNTLPAFILSFVLAEALAKTTTPELIANVLLKRKRLAGHPYVIMGFVLLIMEILTLLNGGFVALFLMWSLVITLAESVGYKKGDGFISFMIPAILVLFIVSSQTFPFKEMAILYTGLFTKGTGLAVPYVPFTVWHLVLQNVYILLLLFVARFIIRLDVSKLQGDTTFFDSERQTMTSDQKFGMTILLGFIIVMFIPSFFPADWAVVQLLNRLGLPGVLIILLSIMTIRRTKQGEGFIDLAKSCAKGINWTVIWMVIATTPLASALEDEACGVISTFTQFVVPIFSGLSPNIFIAVCAIILGLSTQFLHNLVLNFIFIPLLCPICMQLGGNPYTCFLVCCFAMCTAIATPAASANAAFIFGHNYMNTKDAYFNGWMHAILNLLLVVILGIPLANLLFV